MKTPHKNLDVNRFLKEKGGNIYKYLPRFAINWLRKIVHEDEINDFLNLVEGVSEFEFTNKTIHFLNLTIETIGLENIQKEKKYTFASNHPLGGIDGVILIHEIYPIRNDVLFPVNDILLGIPNLKRLFIPINKHGSNFENLKLFKEAFEGASNILYFPAGLCSRKVNGKIIDLDWKKTFLTQSILSKRDVVPVFFAATNSKFFYRLANLRKFLRIKVNIEMLFLIDEMFKQKGRTFKIIFGKPIPIETFDKRYTEKEWTDLLKIHTYNLAKNPNLIFPY